MIGKLLQRKIVWSTLVQLAGKAVQIGIGFFTVKLLTNALGTQQYGVYGQITEFSLFFSTAGNLGIFGNIVRKMADHPKDPHLFWNALLLRLSTGIFFFGLGLAYLLLSTNNSTFFWGTLLFMSSLLLDYLSSVCDATLQARYQMGRATFALLVGRAVNLLLVWLITQNTTALSTTLLGPLGAALATTALSLYFVGQSSAWKGRWNSALQKELLWSSLPFGIINILNNIYYRFLPSALLAKILTDSQYATYSLGLHLSSTVSLFSTFLMFSILPALKHALTENHTQTARELYQKAQRALLALAILVVTAGSLLGPWALTLVSRHDFLAPELWFLLPLLLLLAGVSYFYDLSFITLFALGKERWWLKRELFALTLSLTGSGLAYWLLDSSLQMGGILTVAIAAEATMATWGLIELKRSLV